MLVSVVELWIHLENQQLSFVPQSHLYLDTAVKCVYIFGEM